MRSLFSFIIILIAIFIKAFGSSNKPETKKTSVPNVPKQQQRPVQQMQRPVQRTTQAQRDAYYYNQQKATKDRLQQKYGTQQKSEQKGDILSKAKENVQEKAQDAIQQQLHAEVCRDYRDNSQMTTDVHVHKAQSAECDTGEASDIMIKVNDLIVTGYSGDMTFDRDFIAEGVEMLNRFSV